MRFLSFFASCAVVLPLVLAADHGQSSIGRRHSSLANRRRLPESTEAQLAKRASNVRMTWYQDGL